MKIFPFWLNFIPQNYIVHVLMKQISYVESRDFSPKASR